MRIEISEARLPAYGPLFVWRVKDGAKAVCIGVTDEQEKARKAARRALRDKSEERFVQALLGGRP
jgi:hypothetical protein